MSVRFAPSPTGTFHVGNLRTAWISHRLARALGMPWIVRYEDIDGPRVVAGSREGQRRDMEALGMRADEETLQSEHSGRHETLFREAVSRGDVYPCSCSRKEIQEELARMSSAPHGPQSGAPLYNGRCREPARRPKHQHPTLAWRFRNPVSAAGEQDFIVGRTEPDGSRFVPGYHWACAIDDYDGAYRLLVRAWDLEHAIAHQRQVFEWVARVSGVAREYPAVFHASLVTSNDGHRLEKRTAGVTLTQLEERGISSKSVVAIFENGFDDSLALEFAPGKIWGESKAQLTLGELGFQAE